jgi:hypothetical protein
MFTRIANFILDCFSALALVVAINTVLMLIALNCTGPADAAIYLDPANYHLLEVEDVSVDAYKVGSFRNPYWAEYQKDFDHGFNLNLRFSSLRVLFWEGQFKLIGDGQLRYGGLEFRTGLHFGPYLDFSWWHHSEHLLDDLNNEGDRFPLSDCYGIRLHFIKEKSYGQ